MSKFTNRPMSEYEGALFAAVGIALRSLIDLGISPALLLQRLSFSREAALSDGRTNEAATLNGLALSLRDPATDE